jgi:hypothetical protein
MPCNHRFQNELTSHKHPLNYLFVGTFNPAWDHPNGNNANWFYTRSRNSLWHIMPMVTIGASMLQFRHDTNFLKEWCSNPLRGIGFSDLISSVLNADEENPEHFADMIGFNDNILENYNLLGTDLAELIRQNQDTLRNGGIYLTRYTHTLPRNGQIIGFWNSVVNLCEELNIPNNCLVTPSNGYRLKRERKIEMWQESMGLAN